MTAADWDDSLLTAPLFDFYLASAYMGAKTREVKRWLGVEKGSRGIVPHGSEEGVNFLEFIELLYIKELRSRHGVPFDEIRHMYEVLRHLHGDTRHPFAREGKIQAGGGRVYVDFASDKIDSRYQMAFKDVVDVLADQICFVEEKPRQWWPMTTKGRVVMEPGVAWSAPAVVSHRISTASIFDLYVAEGRRISPVISWFDVSQEDVEAAVAFEEEMRTRRAA
jgi:uncharacterized protein (DUF433 family)